ncbi:Sar s 3 allergen (serine protease-like protein 5) [Sarcoptes scabiei]|uniref:Sar s 3 allergen (Serine protease-like protein 5) n=1 Tax=Sarcoptes scabiei TaxID=52283 RepID=A0A132ALB8_SARSC|nr:Sar s 3 allergen (serine protease-like protein 5) [Sarcoptes scabiei]
MLPQQFRLLSILVCMVIYLQPSIAEGPSEIEEEPWTVAVSIGSRLCGGSILKANFVLTAAQCVWGKQFWEVKVHYGSKYSWKEGTYADIKNMTFLRYRNDSMQNNICILETSEPMKLDELKSKPIALPPLEFDPKPESNVLVSGWGSPDYGYASQLMAANFTVIDRGECRKKLAEIKEESLVTNEIFCAGGFKHGDQCLDHGDEGDPTVQKNEKGINILMGVATIPPWLVERGFPSIFTRVGAYIKWIKKVIGP